MAKERRYIDFMIELRGLNLEAGNFEVAIVPSKELGDPPPVSVRLSYDELEEDLQQLEEKAIDAEDLIRVGRQLADRLLPPGIVRNLFQESVRRAGRDGGVRLRLIIRDPLLARLPWEYSYLSLREGEEGLNDFLVLNARVSLVRHVPLAEQWPSIAPAATDRLRLAALMSNPQDPRFSKLKLWREKKVIEEALRGFSVDGVTVEWEPVIEDATLADLRSALLTKPDFFHFAGHGEFRERDIDWKTGEYTGAGSIVLLKDKESRSAEYLKASDLARELTVAGVRVALLGACESGRQDGVSPWTGVSAALIAGGVPAVVGMQYEVEDAAAIAFNQMCYTSLAAGLSIDEAVSAGRLAMLGNGDDESVEWGVPVLYMRAFDGALFPRLTEGGSATAEKVRVAVSQTVDIIEKGGEVTGIKIDRSGGAIEGQFVIVQKAKNVSGTLTGLVIGSPAPPAPHHIPPPALPTPLPPPESFPHLSHNYDDYDVGTEPMRGASNERGLEYTVWYGTNRRPILDREQVVQYSGERDDNIHYGRCKVFIPESHKIGSLGSPWWMRWIRRIDDRLKLRKISSLEAEAYWEDLRKVLSGDQREALIYIHGYCVSFEEAALRAAQIGCDLNLQGAMAFYSWPSKGDWAGYLADSATIDASEGFIREFLLDFYHKSGAERIHIIAHSMGNRGLLRAMERIVEMSESRGQVKFGQIFLAAPDVDAQIFRTLARAYARLSERTTLYASEKDKALAMSEFLHDYDRAGFIPPVTVVDGIDTIAVSEIDLTLLGHGYYAEVRDVLHDMHNLLTHNAPPRNRMGLRLSVQGGFWVIKA
jgi:esterase/lipase superfamily enzyme